MRLEKIKPWQESAQLFMSESQKRVLMQAEINNLRTYAEAQETLLEQCEKALLVIANKTMEVADFAGKVKESVTECLK